MLATNGELGGWELKGVNHLFSSISVQLSVTPLQLSPSFVQLRCTLGLSSVLVAPQGLALAINKVAFLSSKLVRAVGKRLAIVVILY